MRKIFHVKEIIAHHIAKRLNAGAETALYRGDIFCGMTGGLVISGDNAKVAKSGDFQGFQDGVADNTGAYNLAKIVGNHGIAYARTSAVNSAVDPLYSSRVKMEGGLIKLECTDTTGVAVQAGIFQASDADEAHLLRSLQSHKIVCDIDAVSMQVLDTQGILQIGATDVAINASPVTSPTTSIANGYYVEILAQNRARLIVRSAGATVYSSPFFTIDQSTSSTLVIEARYITGFNYSLSVRQNSTPLVAKSLSLPSVDLGFFARVGHKAGYTALGTPVSLHLRGLAVNCYENP
jgi:hypothetical protein